jgi:alanine racemase
MAVVKADAYGHGATQIAAKIASTVHGFAVNSLQEGAELRKSGINSPILVFEPPAAKTANFYKEHDLLATISNVRHFRILPAGAAYHLNFDTGMGRLGFRPESASEVAKLVAKHDNLHCKGIYSHFATADEPGSPKAEEQYRLFMNQICSNFSPNLLRHICNTAGIVNRPASHFDMVRAGIGLYGYAPGGVSIPGLTPALTWETSLVQVKKIKQDETVSYGAAWKAPNDGFCGIIPVGYADGIPRGLSGNFQVSINGETYPVVGRVTMNYCVVFLGKNRFSTGSVVFLLNERHTAASWANAVGTISYEILTSISSNVPRHYVGSDE